MGRGMGGFSETVDLLTLQLCTRSKAGKEERDSAHARISIGAKGEHVSALSRDRVCECLCGVDQSRRAISQVRNINIS